MLDRGRHPHSTTTFPTSHGPGRGTAASTRWTPLVAALALAGPAKAQIAEGSAVPPRLVEAAEAVWPAGEPVGTELVEVPCRVSLDETGAVVGVEVLESRGAAFDEAAARAIQASTFAPASRDGVAAPSRFVFRWVFDPPASVEPPPVEPPNVEPPPSVASAITFEGEIFGGSDVPIEGAVVQIVSPEWAEPVLALTDPDGRFFVLDLPPGTYDVNVLAASFESLEVKEEIVEGQVTRVVYRLTLLARPFETVVRAQRPPREVTRHTIETVEIVRMPGSGGDALRVVENLPGVARPAFGLGFVVIRGSAPQNTAFYVQGVQVPLLYHFGALRSALAGDLLERLDFYPGNYSVRYGGVTGGILDVIPRTPDRDAWSGYLDVNLIDAAAFAEGPLAPNASIAGGVRRSYLDAVLAGLGDVLPADITQAPVYWDYQLLSDWEPSEDDRVRFFVYGSDDRFAVFFEEPDAGGTELVGERSVGTAFHRFQVEWERTISDDLENRALVAVGYNELEFKAGPGTFDATLSVLPMQLRDELTWRPSDAFQVTFGIDTTVQWESIRLRIPDFFSRQATGRRQSLCALDPFEVSKDSWGWKPGFYLETELRPVEGLRLIPGMRIDLFNGGEQLGIDPRFNVRYEVVDGTILKAGIGQYSQPPAFLATDPGSGNPDLAPEQAVHYGVGVEQDLWGNLSLQVDGFYRETGNAIVASQREVTIGGETRAIGFDNIGATRAYGLEVLLRYEADDLFFGWLAMTLMKAEQNSPLNGWRDSLFDQLLNLTLVGSFDLGSGWSVGFRFRVAQGYPATPIEGAIFDADCDEYEALPGSPGSVRLPWFHQLDLRVDKRFEWEHFVLSIYLDVQNVYYQQNAEALSYNYDFTEQYYTTGLPILPALGIKGEFR